MKVFNNKIHVVKNFIVKKCKIALLKNFIVRKFHCKKCIPGIEGFEA